MPEVISCPACHRNLRVPNELMDRLVKCPTCDATFTATRASEPVPAPLPPPARNTDAALAPPAGQPEINFSLEQDPEPVLGSMGGPPPPPALAEAETSRARTRVERCPYCDEVIPRAALRCPFCEERLEEEDDEEDRPWEREGAVRRDCQPHRGSLVLTLGIIGLAVSPLALCCGIFSLPFIVVSFSMGITAWVMAQGDLRKMRIGEMDPQGRGATTGGMVCGIIATVLTSLFAMGQVLFVVFALARH
jgi:hypothetical protein